ncbi:hypothetical protein DSO57_1006403 [Entomophthora muscae]|uniref:Uncharacterized protein n=1 Tax=Entomophthora muscae TaxID=34485 RepID=A0ACC2TIY4_9FUNG|nr:hypothetical protein DSO57_1006403 [Entomophthora muscae]
MPPTTPSLPSPTLTAINSRFNPDHPNPFAALEEQLNFDDPLLAECHKASSKGLQFFKNTVDGIVAACRRTEE